MENKFSFSRTQFTKLFPFYILIDRMLNVIGCGKSLEKIYPGCVQSKFNEKFLVRKPFKEVQDFEDLQYLADQLLVLETNTPEPATLRGQLEYLPESNEYLFIGSPWFGSVEQLRNNQLRLDDFAFHDPLIDLLHVLKMQEIGNEELKELLHTINNQKKELIKASKAIEDFALISMQDNDPIFRLNMSGDIILMNPAAKALVDFIYQEQRYTAAELWKNLVKENGLKKERRIFEAKCGDTVYSFALNYLEDQQYFNVYGTDITELKKNEEKIRLLSLVASSNKSGVMFTDTFGRIIWVNEGFCKMTGFSQEEILGKTPVELCYGPLSNKEVLDRILDAFYKGRSFSEAIIYYRKDGSWFWGSSNSQPVYDDKGNIVQFYGIIEDITEKKQNEDRARILSLIAEDNINAVIIADKDGCIDWVNKSFTNMTGYRLDEVIGKRPGTILQGEESDPVAIAYLKKQIVAGEPFSTEIVNYSKRGKKYWVRIVGQPITNNQGELQGFFAIEEDITREKMIQKKLVESEQKLRYAMEMIGDNVWEHDFSTGLTTFSKSDHTLLGVSGNSKEENTRAWWDAVYESDKAILTNNDDLYRKGIIDHHTLEYRIRHKSGSIKWVLDRGVVIEKHINGKPLKIIGTHTDITSIKETEEKLRKSQELWNFALESSGVCVWTYDFENNRGSYSSQYAQMLGYGKDEVQEDYDWMLHVHADDKELLRQNDLMYLYDLQNQHSLTYRLRCKDGSYKWILDRGMLVEKSEDERPIRSIGTHTDINHIKQTETELANRVKQFQALSENVPGIIYEYQFRANDWEGLTYVSPGVERLLGIKPEEFLDYPRYLNPEDLVDIRNKNAHSKKTLEPFYAEARLQLPGQSERWLSVQSSFSYRSEQGDIVYTGFILEITERKNTEYRLEKQRQFYEDILNNMPADIAVFNPAHEYLFVNPQGISNPDVRKWIIGKKDEDYVAYRNKPIEIVASRRTLFNNVVSTKTSGEWEEKLAGPDGKEKWILRRFSPVLDSNKNVTLVLGYGIDITQRRLAEDAIRRSEEKYRMLITNMNLGLVEVNKDGIILFANQTFCSMSGYEVEEVIGRETFEILLGDSAQVVKNEITEKRAKGVSEAYELAVKNKRGELKWWLISGAPIFNETGVFTGSIGIHLDITEQKNLEQQLRVAKKDAEESSMAKEVFLANMSHEIRTPMNAIMGMSRQLKKTILDEKQRGQLNAITSASENLLVIINDILDFSKIESGKLTLERIGFRIREVIEHCGQVVEYKLREKGLRFESFIASSMADVFIGDPYRLNQVLLNLLSNAIKFTEKGNISISCTLESQSENHQLVNIAVTDTGIGMTEEFMDSLFSKFSQEDESISRRFGGTGLGMSISKQLVEMMGGQIRVDSKKGFGTSIYISLRLRIGSADDLPAREDTLSDSSILKGSKLLLAEDNEMNRIVANTILEQYGAVVDNAFNGNEAINMLNAAKYDLVLMDVRMPEMDGLEATAFIRQNISTSLPVIALTANALKQEQEKCLKAGMNDFLSKPFDEEDLVKMIAKWLGKEINLQGGRSNFTKDKSRPMYNLEKIKTISRGNTQFVKKMLQIFITESISSVEQLRENYSLKDYAKIKSISHKMKPSVKNMGIEAITDDILFMENMEVNDENLKKLAVSLEKTVNVLTTVVEQLQEELNNMI
ncbi:MAG TPA: PAS domain S-box protein [Panacibacter sp.]|nr:PAS domain S-box protein [Panacibacter sp.]